MCRDVKSAIIFALKQNLAISQVAFFQVGIDTNLIVAFRQGLQEVVGQTKPPGFPVIAGAVGDPLRVVGERVQMGGATPPAACSGGPACCSLRRAGSNR